MFYAVSHGSTSGTKISIDSQIILTRNITSQTIFPDIFDLEHHEAKSKLCSNLFSSKDSGWIQSISQIHNFLRDLKAVYVLQPTPHLSSFLVIWFLHLIHINTVKIAER
jgi:hypothetical protein